MVRKGEAGVLSERAREREIGVRKGRAKQQIQDFGEQSGARQKFWFDWPTIDVSLMSDYTARV